MLRFQDLDLCFLLFFDSKQFELILPFETVGLLTELLAQRLSVVNHHLRDYVGKFPDLSLVVAAHLVQSSEVLRYASQFILYYGA
jgi:hypothetical protein